MKYAQKKAIKSFIKNIDQRYFGGFVRRMFRGPVSQGTNEHGISPEEKEAAWQEVLRQVHAPIPNDYDLKRVEIIVLNYKAPEIEVLCAKYLIENTEWPYKINLFDNRPGTKNMSKILNKLIRESTCNFIVIMDSDCFVPKLKPCWLTRCMETFERYPDCYVVSPAITRISCPQQQANAPRDNNPEKFIEAFPNPCSLHRKEVFEKIGYYDEDFLIYGSDMEWAHRLITSSECSAYLRPDVLVDHIHHYTAKKAAKEEAKYANIKLVEREYSQFLYEQKTGSGNTAGL